MALRVPGQPTTPAPAAPVVATPAPTVQQQVAVLADLAQDVVGAMAVAEHASAANQALDLPNFANAVTGIYGISGSGKTSLAVTGIEFCWEEFGMTSLVYATDLGGFGNKLLSLVRHGIARVWDPRNHLNSFETMEMISLGGFPEHMEDPETGRAAPNARIILPRRIITNLICPQGHPVQRFELAIPQHAAAFETASYPCPTCGVVTSKANGTTHAQIVRHKMFAKVGHRVYDSITEMNDWGLMRLADMSAKGLLPTGKEGGSLLGSADALREGSVTYGGGSFTQVGFMQNRSYQWISNIRAIPDQVVPATCTFAVEQGKADDDSGGVPILGPQVAGNARTSKVPRWVGNCLHASREPDDAGRMVYRLWLTSHLDSRDPRKIPYLAKHRGLPLGMPDFLQDPWHDDPNVRAAAAWSVCSLGVFYRKLIAQLEQIEAAQKTKYPNAPGLTVETGDEVMGDVAATAMIAPAGVNAPVAGGQTMSARRGLRVPGATAPPPGPPPVAIAVPTAVAAPAHTTTVGVVPITITPATSTPAPAAVGPAPGLVVGPTASDAGNSGPQPIPAPVAPVPPVASEAKSVIQQQLEASLAAQAEKTSVPSASSGTAAVASGAVAVPPPPTSSRLRQPGALRVPGATVAPVAVAPVPQVEQTGPSLAHPGGSSVAAPSVAMPTTALPAPAPPPRLPARRTPRPPV